MTISKHVCRNFLVSFACAWLSLSPVWADDTEIFFADVSEGEISPNILFIVDTSGSMNNTVSGTGKTRMQNVQEALEDLLNNLFDVNVGMMRFSNPGGPVLYQVDYIDRNVNETEAGLIDVSTSISADDDDAQEVVATGVVETDNTRLPLNVVTVGNADSWTAGITADDNDAEEFSNGCTNNDSSDLEILYDNGTRQTIGLRFSGVDIPDNATITNAYVTFTVDNVRDGGLAEIDITAEAVDSGDFDDMGDYCNIYDKDFDITNRTRAQSGGSTVIVPWDIPASTVVAGDEQVVTPAVTSLVQAVVDNAAWGGGAGTEQDDIVLIFGRRSGSTSTGEYDFISRDQSSSKSAKLSVEYYVGAPPGDYPALTGLRFQDVNIPKGVTVTNASLTFTAALADANEATALTIYGEDDDEPAAYSSGVASDISGRTKTSESVSWSPATWGTVNETHESPNLQSIVQEIVSRDDWCGGDDMAFIITGTGLRNAYAREAANGYQPVLNIQYEEDTIVAGSSCSESTLTKAIISSTDDVEEDRRTVYTTSSSLNVKGTNKVGFRFTNINLPEDVPIRSAYLEFYSDDGDGGNTNADIRVQSTGDAEAFTSSNGTIDDRTWSSAVTWNITDYWSNNEVVQTPDLKTLVQDIVDRGDWTLGNDIAFLVDYTGGGNDRQIESYDGNASQAAKLVVVFEDDGTETDIRLVRDELIDVVYSLNTQGYTPIQDTLYEAALYYRGDDVDYGSYRGGPNDSGPHSYTRVSVNDSMVSGTYTNSRPSGCTVDDLGASACAGETITGSAQYKTPIDDFCQKSNHIILLTDGSANRPHSDTKIKTMTGTASCLTTFDDGGSPVAVSSSEACVLDLVSHLNSADQSDLKETQSITTHTIGFNFSSPWLEAVADYGGGAYKEATSASDLVTEVEAILEEVLEVDSTFVAPVAAINQFNRLNHRNEVYFAVFRPTDTPNWPGNLKKYQLGTNNDIYDFHDPSVAAINASSGFFKDTARSGWGGIDDGKVVESSGAFSKMPIYSSRNVYVSYTGMTDDDLSDSTNVLSSSNAALTKAMFDVNAMSDAEFAEHLDWVGGKDVDDTYPASLPNGVANGVTAENRYMIGDPLHSKPIAITYGGTEDSPDITVFFGTNSGFLHAVDAETGVEEFAFLPEDMMPLQKTLRADSNSVEHVYGIDGSVTPWVYDHDKDGIIESGDGDFVRFVVGMRRGGRNYYALDVTDRDAPELMWTIKGGQGSFVELGQSWSQPVKGAVDINGTIKDVFYFAGGYDEDQDDTTLRAVDTVGRAIYMVDAATGALIWSGGSDNSYTETYSDMLYSMPADIAVVDINSSGTDNMLFVGDMGGQLWRFDINNGASSAANLVTGGVIADVGVAGGTNSAALNRRFYHRPDVALLFLDDTTKLAVTVGSGYRAHPLSTAAADRFYMFRQDDVFTIPGSYTKIVESDLYDATDNDVGESVSGAAAALAAKKGWYFDTPRTGEKVLSVPLTFKNTVTFTTYEPSPNAVSSNCVPSAGVTRVYQINLEDASPVNNWDDVDGLTEDDRSHVLQSSSIIDEPVIVCTGEGCDLFVGPEKPPIDTLISDRVVKTFWRKN